MRRIALTVVPLLAVVLAAGCSQGNNDDGDPGADSGRSGGEFEADAKGTQFGAGDKNSLHTCIVGDWGADADVLEAVGIASDLDQLGSGANFDLVFTFADDGSYDWKMTLSDSGVRDGEPYSMDGQVDFIGTWKITGSDQMDLTLEETTGTRTVEVAGQTQTENLGDGDIAMATDGATATVTCSESTLKMIENSETVTLNRR